MHYEILSGSTRLPLIQALSMVVQSVSFREGPEVLKDLYGAEEEVHWFGVGLVYCLLYTTTWHPGGPQH